MLLALGLGILASLELGLGILAALELGLGIMCSWNSASEYCAMMTLSAWGVLGAWYCTSLILGAWYFTSLVLGALLSVKLILEVV